MFYDFVTIKLFRENVTMKETVTLNKKAQRIFLVLNQVETGKNYQQGSN